MSLCINPGCTSPNNSNTLLFCQGCGSELLIDGRYRTTRQLGGGGFSRTYEVVSCGPETSGLENRVKVLKVLTQNVPKYVELFEREAQVLAQLNHPGIPRVDLEDFFIYRPQGSGEVMHCLVMEKIEGLNLLEYISRRGKAIEQKRALQWLIQLAKILQEVHKHQFFHRDIKPSNVMLRANGQLALIDFGAVRRVTDTFVSKQAEGKVTGVVSAGYTPPEQVYGKAIPQSDFFALGRTFVFLLTAQEPSEFYDSVQDCLHWRGAAPEVSPPLADFLDRLMARLPHERPRNATEVLQTLTTLYRSFYPSTRSESPEARPSSVESSPSPRAEPTQPLASVPASNTLPSLPPLPTPAPSSLANIPPTPAHTEAILPPTTLPSLPPAEFIARCQETLAEFIGPMAAIVCQRVMSQNVQLSGPALVELLAQKIPNPEHRQAFKQRLL